MKILRFANRRRWLENFAQQQQRPENPGVGSIIAIDVERRPRPREGLAFSLQHQQHHHQQCVVIKVRHFIRWPDVKVRVRVKSRAPLL